jgi:hypothetical protein
MDKSKKKDNNKKGLVKKLKLFFKERDFFQNKLVVWLLAVNFILTLINFLLISFFLPRVDTGIILHYNVYFGVDVVGSWKRAFFMPTLGLAILVVNSLFAAFFYKNKERVASYVLLLGALMAQLSLLIASLGVIIINY